MIQTLQKYWFLVGLLVMLVTGFVAAQPLSGLAELGWLKWSIVCVTMFVMAWPLSMAQLTAALRHPWPALLATALNVGLIPLLVWPIAPLLGAELGPGMVIAAATPSTLASAAVLTRRAGGHDAVAVLVTILTNASCFLVLPAWIYLQTGDRLDPGQLQGTVSKLLWFVVVPIGAGQFARMPRRAAAWATAHKRGLSLAALWGILAIVLLGSISMGLRFSTETTARQALTAGSLALTAGVLLAIHLLVFGLGLVLSRYLGFSRGDQLAVGFAASQKTLMIGLSTAISLGFSMIPIIFFHALQLIADTVLAERLRTPSGGPTASSGAAGAGAEPGGCRRARE